MNPTYQTNPHYSRTQKYSMVPTNAVIDAIRSNGFQMVDFQKRHVRDKSRDGYQKHMAVFEPNAMTNLPPAPEGHKWQIIMNNSHDGSCSFQLFGGCFRFACENGLILGEFAAAIKIRHVGHIESKVRNALTEVYATFETQKKVVEAMQAATPTAEQMQTIAAEIAKDRITKRKDAHSYALNAASVIKPRREEDLGTDLWTFFNRVQENVIRGGIKYNYKVDEERTRWNGEKYTYAKRHNRTTKAIKSFSEQQALNRMVFAKCHALLAAA